VQPSREILAGRNHQQIFSNEERRPPDSGRSQKTDSRLVEADQDAHN